ncbi:MAG: methyl-accepting chemotaxis protein [Planctomycetes bacterium]|nr:methyl-accepting chemotaxis protein [Planctomycetota bacterium]
MDEAKGIPMGVHRAQVGLIWKFIILVLICVASVTFFWRSYALGRTEEIVQDQQQAFDRILKVALNRAAYNQALETLGAQGVRVLDAYADPASLMDGSRYPQVLQDARARLTREFIDGMLLLAVSEGGIQAAPIGPESAKLWEDVPAEARAKLATLSETLLLRPSVTPSPIRFFSKQARDEFILVARPVFGPAPANGNPPRLGSLLLGLSTRRASDAMLNTVLDPETQQEWTRIQAEMQSDLLEVKNSSLKYASLIILVALVLTVGVGKWIAFPLKELEGTVAEVDRDWDLTRRARTMANDEIGRLAQVFNHMITRLAELVQKLQEASLQVGSSSSELLAASEEISQGARNQAKHIEDTSSAVTELSASIQQVAGNARKAAETARRGGESVNKVVDHMSRIRRTVEETSDKIKELGRSSKEIGKIVGVITQISDQTSLLALNAAIEAARAGEHGKGFAVVADEVSKLADRVSRSAKEIEDLISAIREKTDESVHSMELGTAEVETGAGLVNDAGRNFLEIVDVVQETASSVQEQAKASDEISRIIAEILGIAKETVSATEEAVAQGNELRDLALKLEELAKKFKVERKELK